MEEDKMKFRELLQSESAEYFWIRSSFVYRPSTVFQEIIYYYLEKLEASHQDYKVHQWPNTDIANNLRFLGYNHKRISFAIQPAEANPVDFDKQKAQDYADVAKLIVMVHASYGLPEMTVSNCPELIDFMSTLEEIAGNELWIKRHYCLLDSAERIKFYLAFQTRCLNVNFANFFDDALLNFEGIDFPSLYPNGFGIHLVDEPLLYSVYGYTSYGNKLADLIRFVRNLMAHYSNDGEGNPQTIRELEWKLFIRFPFLLHAMCRTLMAVNMYYEFF
ncbi:hypothetical protein LguiB_006494 [Lonicera macranthoides]